MIGYQGLCLKRETLHVKWRNRLYFNRFKGIKEGYFVRIFPGWVVGRSVRTMSKCDLVDKFLYGSELVYGGEEKK